jgi:hypothetical protein
MHLRTSRGTSRSGAAALALWGLNIVLCWPLFSTEYLDQFQSNEGSFIALANFLARHWPHVRWFPWFDCGMPYESTYLPLVPAVVAIGTWLSGLSPAVVFHFVAALAYSLAPVSLFIFVVRSTRQISVGFLAAILWSLLSPSVLLPLIRADVGSAFGLRRLQAVVFYGEVPHNVAIFLLPLALTAITRYLDARRYRHFAVATLAIAAVMSANAFGIVVVCSSAVLLAAVYEQNSWRLIPSVLAMLACGYLVICRFMPPTVLFDIGRNSQLVSGDFRFTPRALLTGVAFTILLCVASWMVRRCPSRMLRFSCLFLLCFGGITLLAELGITFLPQPARYHLEMEMGFCLVAAELLVGQARNIPRSLRPVLWTLATIAAVWVFSRDYQFSRRLIRPASAQTFRLREARWIGSHLPGERIMVSGETQFWLNDLVENPQLSGGHDPTAPNWVQRVAVYTIDTGQNAGDLDGPISVLWLRAFGCGAISVPSAEANDYYHPVRNPSKFDTLLPVIWREGGESIYRVPLRSASLVHVIPSSAVVNRRPLHGLDVADVRTFVAAIEDEKAPPASLQWLNPEHALIRTSAVPGQVISVQITYDRDWSASRDGAPISVTPDQLGMVVLHPQCAGECTVDLQFTEGPLRRACSLVSFSTAIALFALVLVRK